MFQQMYYICDILNLHSQKYCLAEFQCILTDVSYKVTDSVII